MGEISGWLWLCGKECRKSWSDEIEGEPSAADVRREEVAESGLRESDEGGSFGESALIIVSIV